MQIYAFSINWRKASFFNAKDELDLRSIPYCIKYEDMLGFCRGVLERRHPRFRGRVMYSMRKVLFVAAATAALLGAGAAQATTATNLGDADVGIYLKGNPSGSQLPTITDTESDIKMVGDNTGNNLGFGTLGGNGVCAVGSPCVNFYSPSLLDFANGNAVITAHDGYYHELDITVPGYTFGDLFFGVQLKGGDTPDLTIQVFTGDPNTPAADVSVPSGDLNTSAKMSFLIVTPDVSVSTTTSSLITKVVLLSTFGIEGIAGFDETKDFSISNVNAVPLPGALPLMASGLGALGLLGWRRKRKKAMVAA